MNSKILAISLIFLAIFIAGCTAPQETAPEQPQSFEDGSQAIDELMDEYNGEIADIDLGEMI